MSNRYAALVGTLVLMIVVPLHLAMAQAQKKTRRRSAAHTAKKSEVEDRIAALQQSLEEQNRKILELQQQLRGRDATIQQLSQKVDQVQAASAQQQEKLDAARQAAEPVPSLQNQVADLKTATTSTVTTLQETQKRVGDVEHPTAIHFKGVTLTPGGFLAAETVTRSHNESADVISSFNGIPFSGSPNSQLSEFRGTARQSRISLLAEGKAGNIKLTGYYEADFLGAAPTANENQSSSFNLRQRQLWGQAAFPSGWTFTAGQTWSLITTNKAGIETRQEWVPATIEAQYVVGYNFARLFTARVTKKIDDHIWAAFSIENPAVLFSSLNTPANLLGFANGPTGTAGSAFSSTNTISTNLAPDLIAKIAFEPGWGHFEIKALGRFFRDKVPGKDTNLTLGGGIGMGAILPLVPKKVDFILEGLAGNGIARYGDSGNADVTVHPDGSMVPIHTLQALGGIELHPTPKLDWYFYGGDEYLGRAAYVDATGKGFGYGSPLANNSGCGTTPAGACQASMKSLWEGTTGFWYRFYKGGAGTVAMGLQYEYVHRNTWPGLNGISPRAVENMALTSFRYYLP